MDKSELLKHLSKSQVEVTFTKVNGDTRVMTCTRDISQLTEEHRPKGIVEFEQENSDQIRVFDLKANGWRSFNFDRLISVNLNS